MKIKDTYVWECYSHAFPQKTNSDYIDLTGTENNFAKYSENQITPLGTSYDYGSVMHYGAYGFAIDPDVPTIIPHDPNAEIGQRVTLSQLDIERIQILYKCLDPVRCGVSLLGFIVLLN